MEKELFRILLLGLLHIRLILLAALSIVAWVSGWFFETSVIALVAVQLFLFCIMNWSCTSLLRFFFLVEMQSMRSESYGSKLVLLIDRINYTHRNIVISISSVKITLNFESNESRWIMITIINPYVINNISVDKSLPKTSPQTASPTYLERFLNYKKSGLLQLLLRNVELDVINGTVQLIDKSSQFPYDVNLYFPIFRFGQRWPTVFYKDTHGGTRCFISSHLSVYGLWAEFVLREKRLKANFLCDCHFKFSKFGNRAQPYRSQLMDMLLRSQYFNLAVYLKGASFHMSHCSPNIFDYIRENLFYTEKFRFELVNCLNGTQEKGTLKINSNAPVHLKYSTGVTLFVETLVRFMAQYRSADANSRANSSTRQTFPAALDMAIEVNLGKVSFLLLNENLSCLWAYCTKLTMNKSNDTTKFVLSSVGLQMGDYSMAQNFVSDVGHFLTSDCERDNERLTVDEIEIKHVNPDEDFQQLVINLKNTTTTFDKDVKNYIMQSIQELKKFAAKLSPLLPPSPAGNSATISVTLSGTIRFSANLGVGTAQLVADAVEATLNEKQTINVHEAAISYGFLSPRKHRAIYLESQDSGDWTFSTDDKGPFTLNAPNLIMFFLFDGTIEK